MLGRRLYLSILLVQKRVIHSSNSWFFSMVLFSTKSMGTRCLTHVTSPRHRACLKLFVTISNTGQTKATFGKNTFFYTSDRFWILFCCCFFFWGWGGACFLFNPFPILCISPLTFLFPKFPLCKKKKEKKIFQWPLFLNGLFLLRWIK